MSVELHGRRQHFLTSIVAALIMFAPSALAGDWEWVASVGVGSALTMENGVITAPSESLARLKIEQDLKDKHGSSSVITVLSCKLLKGGREDQRPCPDGKVVTPNDASRGNNHRSYGGDGGSPARLTIPRGVRVVAIWVYAGKLVDGLVFEGSDGKCYGFKGYGSPKPVRIKLKDDEYIIGIRGWHGNKWDRIWIKTNKQEYGGESGYGGSGGHTEFKLEVPKDRQFIGLHGRTGKVIDRAGFVTDPK